MSILEDLFTKYGTDKGIWGYTPYYEEAMEARRFDVKRVLEIGICGYRDIPNNVVGASLFVWRDYFPNADIFGVDNDGRFIFNDQQRIYTAQTDAYDTETMEATMRKFGGNFDMIVDDAVHEPNYQIKLMNMLGPYLVHDGRYFMEELCPYKIDGDPLEFYRRQMAPYWRLFVGNYTHKPEVLGLGIK